MQQLALAKEQVTHYVLMLKHLSLTPVSFHRTMPVGSLRSRSSCCSNSRLLLILSKEKRTEVVMLMMTWMKMGRGWWIFAGVYLALFPNPLVLMLLRRQLTRTLCRLLHPTRRTPLPRPPPPRTVAAATTTVVWAIMTATRTATSKATTPPTTTISRAWVARAGRWWLLLLPLSQRAG